jgi:hypothetical protein
MRRVGVVALLLAASACKRDRDSPLLPTDPTPEEVVERARAAQQPGGFRERLAFCVKGRGTFQGKRERVDLSVSNCQKGDDRGRLEFQGPDKSWNLIVDDGHEAWAQTAKGVRPVRGDELAVERRGLYVEWVHTLWPLRERDLRLTPLRRRNVRGATAIGVKVSRDGQPDVELYFDTTSWLVVELAWHDTTPEHETVYDEHFYSAWRTADGVHYASHVETSRDGKPRHVSDFEATFPDELSDDQFRKPTQ